MTTAGVKEKTRWGLQNRSGYESRERREERGGGKGKREEIDGKEKAAKWQSKNYSARKVIYITINSLHIL
jgi:hypothetical protein